MGPGASPAVASGLQVVDVVDENGQTYKISQGEPGHDPHPRRYGPGLRVGRQLARSRRALLQVTYEQLPPVQLV